MGANSSRAVEPSRFDIALRRLTEEALIFAGELTGALISDFESGPGSIESLDEHSFSRGVQAKVFLVLQRAQRSYGAKMMVQCRNAHVCNRRELIELERFHVVRSQPGYGPGCPVAVFIQFRHCAQAISLRILKHAINDLTVNQIAQKQCVPWSVQQIHEANTGLQEIGCALAYRSRAKLRLTVASFELFPVEDFSYDGHIKPEKQGKQRHVLTCCDNLAYEGYLDRGEKKSGFITNECRPPNCDALSALCEDRDA